MSAPPPLPVGWDPSRTATGNIGRPPRLEVGDRVQLVDVDLTGYVVERAGPLVAVGWLSAGRGGAPADELEGSELVRSVWGVTPAPAAWAVPDGWAVAS